MAKILSQDPQTGFVTMQLDDGRITYAPADTAYKAFPSVREPAPEQPSVVVAPSNDLMNPFAGQIAPSPVPDVPLPSGPSPATPAPAQPAPVEAADPTLDDLPVVDDELRQSRPGPADQTSFASPLDTMQQTPRGAFGAPREGGARQHTGVDYQAAGGTPLRAMAPGVVVSAGPSQGDAGKGGNRVWIDYGGGRRSAYMHMDEINVHPGEQVQPGQVVGTVGNTGTSSSGPHLHAVYELGGKRVNEPEFLTSFGGSDKFSLSTNTAAITSPPDVQLQPVGGGFDVLGQQLQKADFDKRQAMLAEGGIRSAMAADQEQAARDTEDLLRRERGRRLIAQDQMQQRLAQEDQRIQAAIDAIPQVDPDRYWSEKGKVGAVIGMAAAGLAGFLNPGGKNPVVDTIQEMIQNDLRAQEVDINTARQKVGQLENRYGRISGRLEQDELAKRELALYKLETVKAGLAAKMASFASPLTQAEYAGAIAELDAKGVKDRAELFAMKSQHMLAQSQFEHKRWFDNEQVKLDKNRLSFSVSQAENEALKAGKGVKIPEPKGVIGKSTGFSTIDGKDFIVPGETETERADSAKHLQEVSQGAAEVLTALKKLQSMDFGPLAKLDPGARQERIAALWQATMGSMSASGQSIARASNLDVQGMMSRFGGDLTTMQALLDSDGKVRKELVSEAYDQIIIGANALANSRGKVIDADVNKYRQRAGRELTIDELEAAGLLKDAKYEPPPWAKQLRVSAESREESTSNLINTRVGPGTSGLEESATTIPRGQAILKDALAGKFDQDPGAVMSAAESMKSLSKEFKASKNSVVRDKASDAAQLSLDLAKAAVAAAKRAYEKGVSPTTQMKGGGGRQTIITTPAPGLTEEETKLLNDIQGISPQPYTTGTGKPGFVRSAPSNK